MKFHDKTNDAIKYREEKDVVAVVVGGQVVSMV